MLNIYFRFLRIQNERTGILPRYHARYPDGSALKRLSAFFFQRRFALALVLVHEFIGTAHHVFK